MNPRRTHRSVVLSPLWALALALSLAPAPAGAQGERGGEERARTPDEREARSKGTRKPGGRKRGKKKEKIFDFTGLQLDASMRMPQLLYFLDRANQELKRASLEKRSFIPEMVRTVQEEEL